MRDTAILVCHKIDGRFDLPRKVVEMYSDTWFPERLISDKWDSSLFNILLNWREEKAQRVTDMRCV